MSDCEWCKEGRARVLSSVSERFVHPDTPIGRVVCELPLETAAEDALRCLASFLGAGGYNAPEVDAKEFEAKIRWGIDRLTEPLTAENAKLRAALDKAEKLIMASFIMSTTTARSRKISEAHSVIITALGNADPAEAIEEGTE